MGRLLRWKKKGFVCAPSHQEFGERHTDSKKNKLSDVEWNKNRIFFFVHVKTWKVRHVFFAVAYLFKFGSVLRGSGNVFHTLPFPVLFALGGGTLGPLGPCVQSLGYRLFTNTQ